MIVQLTLQFLLISDLQINHCVFKEDTVQCESNSPQYVLYPPNISLCAVAVCIISSFFLIVMKSPAMLY